MSKCSGSSCSCSIYEGMWNSVTTHVLKPTDGMDYLRGSAHTNTFLKHLRYHFVREIHFYCSDFWAIFGWVCALSPCGSSAEKKRGKKTTKKEQPTVLGVQITPTSLLKSIHYLSMWCKYLTEWTGTQGCQEGYPRVVRETALPFQK